MEHAPVLAQHAPPQVVAEQAPPEVKVPPEQLPAAATVVQTPVAVMQQEPPQGVGEQTPWRVKVPPAQVLSTVVQASVEELQQDPPQGLGEQTVPAPWKVVPVAHTAAVTERVHAPVVVLQHAPDGQGLGVQTEPAPMKVLASGHWAWEEMVQTTASVQHAP
jgi:hypothetical protein